MINAKEAHNASKTNFQEITNDLFDKFICEIDINIRTAVTEGKNEYRAKLNLPGKWFNMKPLRKKIKQYYKGLGYKCAIGMLVIEHNHRSLDGWVDTTFYVNLVIKW